MDSEPTPEDLAQIPPAANVERPALTFEALLVEFNRFDSLVGEVPINWAETLGGDLRDKVDAIDYVLDTLKHRAEFWAERAAPMLKRSKSALKNYESLRAHLATVMERENFHAVPGHECRIQLHDSEPSLDVTRKVVTAADYQAYPDLVEPVRSYKWRNEALKEALLAGKIGVNRACDFARVVVNKHVRFWPIKPELPAKKGKKK